MKTLKFTLVIVTFLVCFIEVKSMSSSGDSSVSSSSNIPFSLNSSSSDSEVRVVVTY